jgi:hypothetical protein
MKFWYCILIPFVVHISSSTQAQQVETTHYIFPEFSKAVVLLKDGKKKYSVLNYNALTEELVIERRGQKLAIALEGLSDIDTVFIMDRKFVLLDGKIVELLYHSKWDLFVEYKCKIKDQGKSSGYGGVTRTGAIQASTSITSHSDSYQLKLPDGYEVDPYSYYWFKKNGEVIRFISMGELKKLYKDKKDVFRAHVKKHRTKYGNQESIIQLIEYLESDVDTPIY